VAGRGEGTHHKHAWHATSSIAVAVTSNKIKPQSLILITADGTSLSVSVQDGNEYQLQFQIRTYNLKFENSTTSLVLTAD